MAGRNKRLAARFLRDLEWAILRAAAEQREADERFYSGQMWRAFGVRGLEEDIERETAARIFIAHQELFAKLPMPNRVPSCRFAERPDNWARVFPHTFTGRVEWRGNRFPFEVTSESVLTRRRWNVREIGRDAARALGRMQCRHVGEKRRAYREDAFQFKFGNLAIELGLVSPWTAVETYIRCEDCGEEVRGG